MPRARNIKPGFFKNEVLASLTPMARLLFAGLWVWADKDGRLEDRPKRIRAEIFPYDDCDIDELLNQLAANGFIARYEVGTIRVIQVSSWEKHGNPYKNEPSYDLPSPLQQVATCCNKFEHSGENGLMVIGNRKKEEEEEIGREKKEEGGAGGDLTKPRPMAEFCDSAEALAQEFCAVHAGPRNAVEKNPLEVTSTIGEILKRSTPSAVRARIRDPSRMKTEKLWQFVKHFEDGRHGKRPKQNMRETECQPVD